MNPQTNARRAAALRRRRMARRRLLALATIAAIVIGLIIWLVISIAGKATYTPQDTPKAATIEPQGVSSKTPMVAPESTPESTEGSPAYYYITDEERALIEQVVSAESRGEPYDGQVAVTQCILNACLKDDITPEQAIKKYKYTSARVEPTRSVREAVAAVFDRGEGVTEEPILYFYNPAIVDSEFHESQTFVIEIANHKFFKEGPAE